MKKIQTIIDNTRERILAAKGGYKGRRGREHWVEVRVNNELTNKGYPTFADSLTKTITKDIDDEDMNIAKPMLKELDDEIDKIYDEHRKILSKEIIKSIDVFWDKFYKKMKELYQE